ncbi:ubiquitin carboxyl-terminal hydrolase CYLD [Carcharodon carcharias]|uniref:ubiquitin carboxyl-terminal hydrolase CYLD n=1 Tax=Carcharodon carcharias TaxID=13397 RepID=UPI001B7EA7CD|nr:ubiquitin carboxyl-terminal hydrolase CYLD [Carcharodon carcharias]XP_041040814.1 ubiquitin carboxyl-terminal hydrolase CYLD [Carcharodon carcharias]XP_041040815.1 ubiquitin carboxyl-terminal hydrolase CYLD [Carcharodon carcharias]
MFFPSKKETKYLYFILMEDLPVNDRVFPAGNIALIAETDYLKEMQAEPQAPGRKLKFHLVEADVHLALEVDSLHQLSQQEAGLLQAVSPSARRFSLYLEKEMLENARQIRQLDLVTVEYKSKSLPGIVRYIGSICDMPKLSGTFFGIELQVEGEAEDQDDGKFGEQQYFHCKKGCGIFVPFNKVTLRWSFGEAGGVKTHDVRVDRSVNTGDRVVVCVEEEMKGGTVMGFMDGGLAVLVNLESDQVNGEEPKMPLRVPLHSIIKENMLLTVGSIRRSTSRESQVLGDGGWLHEGLNRDLVENGGSRSDRYLGVKSVVQIDMGKGQLMTGVIQWMGHLPAMMGEIAGVELDEDKGFSDGTWKGHRYFQCAAKRGIFVRAASCQPDTRFQSLAITLEDPERTTNRESCVVPVILPPPRNEEAVRILQGRMRGIQGHCNSCYMDSALFSLFSCTLVLDSMLHKSTNHQFGHIQRILREEIVNPLRRDGFVDCKKVMNLRKELTQCGYCAGFTTEEKDPEEFLNVIMQHVLGLEPLLKLKSAGQKEQECYCHQIFIDKDDDLIVPTVQQLVEHSFHSNHLKLAEVPSCFIIQMPRFGKNYKMFEKIIPSLELDITDLLCDSPRECCLCGELAAQECEECFKDKLFSKTGLKQYCDTCWCQVHSHSSRRSHQPMKLKCPDEFARTGKTKVPRERMQLFAVLCIETSHYVSFIKYGPEDHQWMFFDSMSDRHGGEGGYNIPTVTLCPEVAKYVKSSVQLIKEHPRDMEGVAKRQLCDAYMYLYENPRMAVYK